MASPDPPYQSPPIEVKDRKDASRLPGVQMTQDWIDHFFFQTTELNAKPTRKATDRQGPKSANIGTTPLPIDEVGAGLWRLTYYIQILTPGTLTGTVQVQFSWMKNNVVQTETMALLNGNTTGTHQFAMVPIDVDDNSPITYATTYTSTGATPMEYGIVVMLEECAITRELA